MKEHLESLREQLNEERSFWISENLQPLRLDKIATLYAWIAALDQAIAREAEIAQLRAALEEIANHLYTDDADLSRCREMARAALAKARAIGKEEKVMAKWTKHCDYGDWEVRKDGETDAYHIFGADGLVLRCSACAGTMIYKRLEQGDFQVYCCGCAERKHSQALREAHAELLEAAQLALKNLDKFEPDAGRRILRDALSQVIRLWNAEQAAKASGGIAGLNAQESL